ncbi:MAG: IclR family transcriptional regulator [Chloroflexi bacterium]|nr:IclR family transcriptional regulator [Chloroflexota bacterium]
MATGDNSSEKSLARAVSILDCFRPEQPEWGVSEIARHLHLSRSTAGRLLQSLQAQGVLGQNTATRRYIMGSKVLTWSSAYMSQLDVARAARAALVELHRVTCETASIYVREGTERICVERIESPESVRVVVRRGERMPLHAGSAGKALLAFAPEEIVRQVLSKPLERMTSRTIVVRKQLLKELEIIRNCGYAISHGERFEDALGLGAPIFDSTGRVVAALNVAGPITRFTDDQAARFTPILLQLAAQASQAMGYRGTYFQSILRSE